MKLGNLLSRFSLNTVLGIDLGTAYTVVYRKGRGEVAVIPSYVAFDAKEEKVIAIGEEAKRMYGRTKYPIMVVRPVRDGVINNLDYVGYLLSKVIREQSAFISPTVVVGVPSGATDVERKSVVRACEVSGARKVYLIDEPVAAAIGIGLDVNEKKGRLIVDIGGGTTEIAVISMGRIVEHNSLRIGGDEMDEAINEYIKMKFGITVGLIRAEEIKKKIGNAYPDESEEEVFEITDYSSVEHRSKKLEIRSSHVREALDRVVEEIIRAIDRLLTSITPELRQDIANEGIYLSGGGSLIKGLDKRISTYLKIDVHRAKDPLKAVINGIGKVVENMSQYRHSIYDGKYNLKFR